MLLCFLFRQTESKYSSSIYPCWPVVPRILVLSYQMKNGWCDIFAGVQRRAGEEEVVIAEVLLDRGASAGAGWSEG